MISRRRLMMAAGGAAMLAAGRVHAAKAEAFDREDGNWGRFPGGRGLQAIGFVIHPLCDATTD